MDKDRNIIKHIIEHIENIFKTQKRFGGDIAVFISDRGYFNSVCMGLLYPSKELHLARSQESK